MDNPWLVNAAENGLKASLFKKIEEFPGDSGQATDRRVFFLEALGAVFAREATTAMGDILAFSEAAGLATELLLLSGVREVPEDAGGGFEGFFFVISS